MSFLASFYCGHECLELPRAASSCLELPRAASSCLELPSAALELPRAGLSCLSAPKAQRRTKPPGQAKPRSLPRRSLFLYRVEACSFS